ncbi:hypothetical protein ACQY0O_005449 [Thecaphora frezii]
MSTSSYTRLIRFIPTDSADPSIGEPTQPDQDVGLAVLRGEEVEVDVFQGTSILQPGSRTPGRKKVAKLLSPLSADEVGTIRCIGLNYKNHAEELKVALPRVPTLFMKPETALAHPYPTQETIIPKPFVEHDAADYESELAIVIGKQCKNVSEEEALDYLLGFTAANDISSRLNQFAQSQWSYSKSFDGACPIGPAFVSKSAVERMSDLKMTGTHNGRVVQRSGLDDLIFPISKIISFLSQGTTLKPGTLILTGTPAGVGWMQEPKNMLRDGDEFHVTVSHGVGTLVSRIVNEK